MTDASKENSMVPCYCAWCDWVRRNSRYVIEPAPGHTYTPDAMKEGK